MTDYIDDPDWHSDVEAVRKHYRFMRPVYEALAELGDEYPCLGFGTNAGWYVSRDEDNIERLKNGWEEKARCCTFTRDWREIIEEQLGADGRDREVYNITSWKRPDAPYEWVSRRHDDENGGYEYDGEKPTPGYADLRGFGFWCDLDLADKRGRTELTETELETVEAAQQRVIDLVADLYGVETDAVYALDSGGGSYVYGPPEAALPLVEYVDDADDVESLLDDIRTRFRDEFAAGDGEAFDGVWPTVTDEIDGAGELLDPDWIQNVNRQSKAPGAVHHSHDLVVTPLRERDPDTGEVVSGVDYTPTLVSETDAHTREQLTAWAEGLTADDHRDAVGSLVCGLYPTLATDSDDWREVVDERLETLRERREAAEERRENVRERIREHTDGETDTFRSAAGEIDVPVTDDRDDVLAAVETIEVREVIRRHACDEWDTSARPHETTFDPSWRESRSGKSCAVPNGSNGFIDNGCNSGGGPLRAYALGEGLIGDATEKLNGKPFGEALDGMRAEGYNIPLHVPSASEVDGEKTPWSVIRKAAFALGVCDPDDTVEKETDDGGTYQGLPDGALAETLEKLEERGVEHGYDRSGTSTPDWKHNVVEEHDEYDDVSEVPDSPTEAIPGFTAEAAADAESDEQTADEPAETGETSDARAGAPDDDNESAEAEDDDLWSDARATYAAADDSDSPVPKGAARRAAADALETEADWLYVLESERLWKYDPDSGTYSQYGKEALRQMLESADRLGQFFSRTERREVQARIEARNGIHRSQLDARDRGGKLICVGNGVVDLETGELHDHSPEYRMTRGLEWDYDENADPSAVREFLDDVTERAEDRDTLLDHLAHGLLPGHPQRAFVVTYGPGSNGKTRVARLFSGFVGDENAAAVEIDDLVNNDFATSDLVGTYLNWGDDMSGDRGGALTDVSMLKKASGGSEIRANEKYEKTFKFQNQASLFFSANEPPRFGEQTPALADRLYPIRMPYRFVTDPDEDDPMQKQREPRVAQKLLDDTEAMRGLLALVVEHARDVLETGEYSQPEGPEERMKKYRGQADPIVRFCRTALEPADGDHLVRKDDAYTVYQKYAEAWDERVAGEDGFKRQLSRAAPFDLDTSQSRALAGDGDGDRVRCWKYVTWSDDAVEVMPGWVGERYDLDVGGDDVSDSDGLPTPDALAPDDVTEAVVDETGRVPAVEARVTAAWIEEEYGSMTQKLTLSDGDGTRTATTVGTDRQELREGVRVILTGARASKGEFGGIELKIDPQTDVTIISTPADDTAEERAAASTDGGTNTDSGGMVVESETSAESTDDDPREDDPERPHGPHDDAQCRECGLYWQAGSPDDAPRQECPDCETAVDWKWNVDTGRVPASAAPDSPEAETDHETVRGKIIEWIRGYDPEPVTVTRATVDLGVDADDARDALDALVEDGRLIDTDTEGRYEVNR